MRKFLTQPNPDAFETVERIPIDHHISLQTWKNDDETFWVLAIVNGDKVEAHAAVKDDFAAKLIRYHG